MKLQPEMFVVESRAGQLQRAKAEKKEMSSSSQGDAEFLWVMMQQKNICHVERKVVQLCFSTSPHCIYSGKQQPILVSTKPPIQWSLLVPSPFLQRSQAREGVVLVVILQFVQLRFYFRWRVLTVIISFSLAFLLLASLHNQLCCFWETPWCSSE